MKSKDSKLFIKWNFSKVARYYTYKIKNSYMIPRKLKFSFDFGEYDVAVMVKY